MLNVLFMALLGGCGDLAAEGEACTEDADCDDGLHCHIEEAADADADADADAEGTCEADDAAEDDAAEDDAAEDDAAE